MANHRSGLLTQRRFAPLFTTQFFGALNDNLFKNALVILLAYGLAEAGGYSAPLMITLAAGIFILPFFLFSALAGQMADKYEKAMLIRWIKLAELAIAIMGAAGFYFEHVEWLMLTLFAMGTHSAFFGPLKYAILPDHLKPDELLAGNALVEAGTFMAILLGTILGGLLILTSHGAAIVSGLLILFALSGYMAARWVLPAGPAVPELRLSPRIFRESWRVIGQARERKDVFYSIMAISWFWLVGATFLAQFPTFAKDVMGGDETVVTLFLCCFTVGIAAGSMLCNRWMKGSVSGLYVPMAAVGLGASMIAMGVTGWLMPDPGGEVLSIGPWLAQPAHWWVLLWLTTLAVSGGIFAVPLYTLIQERCAPDKRARIIAANNILNALFMVVSAVLALGFLAMGFSLMALFTLLGIATLLLAGFMRRTVTRVREDNRLAQER